MSTPSRPGGRPDPSGASKGRSGGSAHGRAAGGDASGQGRRAASGSGRGAVRGSRQEPGASRWSARGTTGNRSGKGEPRGATPGAGGSAQPGGAPRQGSVGRGSWDRHRSEGGPAPGAGRSRAGDNSHRGGRTRGDPPGGPARSGGPSSASRRGVPRTTGAGPGTGERARQRADRRPDAATPAAPTEPPIPDWAHPNLLEDAVRDELSSLTHANAATVAGHLVAAGEFLDEDPQLALAHARAARASASRLACVREAVGVAAYHAENYAEASRELRAYRRLSGRAEYLAVLADCDRAAGRPDAALRLLAEAPRSHPGHSEWVEQRIVEAGARRDLGEIGGAVLVLRDALTKIRKGTGVDADDLVRLRYAYADGLEAAGRNDEAIAEFAAIADSDGSEMTDAALRAGLSPSPEGAPNGEDGVESGPVRGEG